jgi:hypothetical protein
MSMSATLAKTVGLIGFLTAFAVDVVLLLIDLFLWADGLETISQHVWSNPVLGLPIILVQVVGGSALGLHFYGRAKETREQENDKTQTRPLRQTEKSDEDWNYGRVKETREQEAE